MIDYCVSVFRKTQEERLYRSYITDALMTISGNTGAAVQKGRAMTARYAELVGWVEVDTRTGDEIAMDIINRAGLRAKE